MDIRSRKSTIIWSIKTNRICDLIFSHHSEFIVFTSKRLVMESSLSKSTYALAVGARGEDRLNLTNKIYNPYSQLIFEKLALKDNMNILTLGCGIGIMDTWLAKQISPFGKITATDISQEQIILAEKLAKENKITNIEFKLLDSLAVCFLNDIFQRCDKPILETITPILTEIFRHNVVKHLKLSTITDEHVNCEWLFEQAALLFSTEIWNTFGAWVESSNPKLSPEVLYKFNNYAKPANRKDIQSTLCKTKSFSKKLNEYLQKGNILCFPTTVDLAPRLDQITDEFLSKRNYYPKSMGVTAISGFSRAPQITTPLVEYDGVPFGLSFVASYGQDMMLVKFCNELQEKLVRKNAKAV